MGRFLNLRDFLKSFIKQKPFKKNETVNVLKHNERIEKLQKKEYGKHDEINSEDWIY